jgi:hypothetical protein
VKPLPVREKVPIVAMMRFPSVDRTATIAISMKVDRTGGDRPAPLGAGTKWRAADDSFFVFRDAKPEAAEKSWRRTLRD